MSDVKITTNNVPREIIDATQLSLSARAEFYYLDWEAIKDGRDSASFFRYKGELYDLGEFMRIESGFASAPFKHWHGVQSDSHFSGLLVRYTPDHDSIIVGRYYTS
jgi:hypothetical protein